MGRNRAVFLDRDGVINRKPPDGQYVTQWEDFKILPGVAGAILSLNQAGWLTIIVTNQRAVAKKLISESELRNIHQNMIEALNREGAKIDAIYYCPHGVKDDCECRKPKPGMLHQAAKEHGVSLSASWMVGDNTLDIQAGKAAGCKTIWLAGAGSPTLATGDALADAVVHSLSDAVQRILSQSEAKLSGI